jgi:hypothetical protein
MNFKVDIVDVLIEDLSIQAYVDAKQIDIFIPNKLDFSETILLVSCLLGADSKQILFNSETEKTIQITCAKVNVSQFDTVVFKVQREHDFVTGWIGKEDTIDLTKSKFEFYS